MSMVPCYIFQANKVSLDQYRQDRTVNMMMIIMIITIIVVVIIEKW